MAISLPWLLLGVLAVASLYVWMCLADRLRAGKTLVNYEPREDVPWNGLDVALLFLCAVGLMVAAVALHGQLAGIDFAAGANDPALIKPLLTANCVGEALSVGLAVLYLVVKAGARATDLGLGGGFLKDLWLGLVAFVAASLPVFGLMALLTYWFPYSHPLFKLLEQQPDPATLWLVTIVGVVVAPIAEEFFFRLVLQGWLERVEHQLWRDRPESAPWPPGGLPILLSSLAFAAVHIGNGPDQIPLFVLALGLGYLYRQTHGLVPSITAHMLVNGISVVQLWLESAGS